MPTSEEERRRKFRVALTKLFPDLSPSSIEAKVDIAEKTFKAQEVGRPGVEGRLGQVRPPPRGLPQRPEEEGGSPFVRFLKGQLGDSWKAITDTLGPPMEYLDREIVEPFGRSVAVSVPNLLRGKTSWRESIPFTDAMDARVEREKEQYRRLHPAVKFAAEAPLGFLVPGAAQAKFGLESAAAGLGTKGALPGLLRSGAEALGPIASVEAVPGAVLGAAARGAGRALRPSQTAARAARRRDPGRTTLYVKGVAGGAPSGEAKLPQALAGAKPNYSIGQQRYSPQFESDIDKALFIVAQKDRSRSDESYMAWLRKALPKVSDEKLRAAGANVRVHIKRTVAGEPAGPVTIPTSGAVRKLTAAAPTAAAPTAAPPTAAARPTTPTATGGRVAGGTAAEVTRAAPKYENYSLKFDNDIDKALYVVAQSEEGNVRRGHFITWLEKQGIPEAELDDAKKGVTEHVQAIVDDHIRATATGKPIRNVRIVNSRGLGGEAEGGLPGPGLKQDWEDAYAKDVASRPIMLSREDRMRQAVRPNMLSREDRMRQAVGGGPGGRPPGVPPTSGTPGGVGGTPGGGGQPDVPLSGKPNELLPDFKPFGVELGIALEDNPARKLAQYLAGLPKRFEGVSAKLAERGALAPGATGLALRRGAQLVGAGAQGVRPIGKIVAAGDPAATASTTVQKAAVGRGRLRWEGEQKVNVAMSHARTLGTQEDLFGPTDLATGLLTRGEFQGLSLNRIQENINKYRPRLTPEMVEWLRRMTEIENAVLGFYTRAGIKIKEVPLEDHHQYAGRIVMGKQNAAGEFVSAKFVGPGPGKLRPTGQEKHRSFKSIADGEKEGFVYMPYEKAVEMKARAAMNRVADKKMSDWIVVNLPEGVIIKGKVSARKRAYGRREGRFDPKSGAKDVEGRTIGPPFEDKVLRGVGAQEFAQDLTKMLAVPDDKLATVLRAAGQWNDVQKTFALAGDASLFSIQLIMTGYTHPMAFFKSGVGFATHFRKFIFDPANARRARQRLLETNKDLLQRMPGLNIGGRNEFTQSLGEGGLMGPGGVLSLPASALRPFQEAFEYTMDMAGIYLARGLEHLAENDPRKINVIVDYVNNMRGMGASKRAGVSAFGELLENSLLLAPRYRRAVFAHHVSALQGGLRGDLARNSYGHLVVGMAMTHLGMNIALGVKQGKSLGQITQDVVDGINPKSRKFLLWRVGGQMVGPGSKIVSDLRFLSKVVTRPDQFLNEGMDNPGIRWVRGQLAASPSTAWDWFTGRDYVGHPVRGPLDDLGTYKNIARNLGENVMPIWAQSVLFEGGTIGDRATRFGGEFFGLRTFPQGAGEILRANSERLIGVSFEDSEPYERDILEKNLKPELTGLQTEQVKRGREDAGFFQVLDDLDAERVQKLEGLRKLYRGDSRRIKDQYFNIELEYWARRSQEGRTHDFGDTDPNDPDPQKAALAQWYLAIEGALVTVGAHPEAKLLDSDKLERIRSQVLRRNPEHVDYIRRNTNRRIIPRDVLAVLRARAPTTYRRYQESVSARARHRRMRASPLRLQESSR